MSDPAYPLSDTGLARRLERCEALTNAATIDARARLDPQSGAARIEHAGTHALFDGIGSPLSQTFCLGMFAPPVDDDLAIVEEFFENRGAAVFHEVSPLADAATLAALVRRAYRPVEFTSILFRPTAARFAGAGEVRVRIIERGEERLWGDTAAAGWMSEGEDIAEWVRGFGVVTASAKSMYAFLAEREGRPIATGALSVHDGVSLLAGASTIPSERGRGAQRALLRARLAFAASLGCDLAMMGALPGSASQRNAERQGFRIAYTRIKWGR